MKSEKSVAKKENDQTFAQISMVFSRRLDTPTALEREVREEANFANSLGFIRATLAPGASAGVRGLA